MWPVRGLHSDYIDQSEAFILAVVLQVSKHAMWPLWSDDDYLIGFVKFMQAMLARQGNIVVSIEKKCWHFKEAKAIKRPDFNL